MGHVISECDSVPDPELDMNEMPSAFHSALNIVLKTLKGYGINERIDVSLKQFSGDQQCWLAMYIRESQFKGNLKFYVNTRTPGIVDAAVLPQSITIEDVFVDSLYHEWGHVLEEFSRMGEGGEEMNKLIYGPFSDEEDFAEYMVDFFRYHRDTSRRAVVEKVIKMYVENVF
jgi:hypothetical protein